LMHALIFSVLLFVRLPSSCFIICVYLLLPSYSCLQSFFFLFSIDWVKRIYKRRVISIGLSVYKMFTRERNRQKSSIQIRFDSIIKYSIRLDSVPRTMITVAGTVKNDGVYYRNTAHTKRSKNS
jgi:hypothetical protein